MIFQGNTALSRWIHFLETRQIFLPLYIAEGALALHFSLIVLR